MPIETTWRISTTPDSAATLRPAAPVLVDSLHRSGIIDGLVIDLGCGSGILSHTMSRAGYDVLGIDISASMIALARQRVPQGQFRVDSLLTAEFPRSVAIAAVGECINYLFDAGNTRARLARLFRRIHESLTPGGVFLLRRRRTGARARKRVLGGVISKEMTGPCW